MKVGNKYKEGIWSQTFADEEVVMAWEVRKHNKHGQWQRRNLLLTNRRIRTFYNTKLKRVWDVAKVKALTKNTLNGDIIEFAIHVDDEFDYRFLCNDREDIFNQIKSANYKLTGQIIPVYAVDGALDYYITSREDRLEGTAKGLPPDKYRIEDGTIVELQKLSSVSYSSLEDELELVILLGLRALTFQWCLFAT